MTKAHNFIREFVRDYGWIHLGIGVFGQVCFFIGSVFFLWEMTKRAGIWLFIVGSGGMLIGKIGSAIVERENHRLHAKQD